MYELVPHVADVRLRVQATSIEGLFTEALRGMYAAMGAEPAGGPDVTRTLEVTDSVDLTALLVDFLNDVLHRAHVGAELFDQVRFERLGETDLVATVSGTARASFREDVKAVTYHEANVRGDGSSWSTMLVFDI